MLLKEIYPRVELVDSARIYVAFTVHFIVHYANLFLKVCVLLSDVFDDFVFLLDHGSEVVGPMVAYVLFELFA